MCTQGDEKIQNCKVRNILYENCCTLCKVDEKAEKRKNKPYLMDGRGVYVHHGGERDLHGGGQDGQKGQ